MPLSGRRGTGSADTARAEEILRNLEDLDALGPEELAQVSRDYLQFWNLAIGGDRTGKRGRPKRIKRGLLFRLPEEQEERLFREIHRLIRKWRKRIPPWLIDPPEIKKRLLEEKFPYGAAVSPDGPMPVTPRFEKVLHLAREALGRPRAPERAREALANREDQDRSLAELASHAARVAAAVGQSGEDSEAASKLAFNLATLSPWAWPALLDETANALALPDEGRRLPPIRLAARVTVRLQEEAGRRPPGDVDVLANQLLERLKKQKAVRRN